MVEHEVVFVSPGDPPSAVVQGHVVVSAEQYPAVDVGPALIPVPFVDVVGFAV